MFDVNSLGGKLIDNQNLKKALENGGGSFLPIIEFNATRQGVHGYTYSVAKNELPSAEEWDGSLIVKVKLTDDVPYQMYGYLYTDTITCHSFPFFSVEGTGNYFGGLSCIMAEFKNYDAWQVGTTVEQTQYEEHIISFGS